MWHLPGERFDLLIPYELNVPPLNGSKSSKNNSTKRFGLKSKFTDIGRILNEPLSLSFKNIPREAWIIGFPFQSAKVHCTFISALELRLMVGIFITSCFYQVYDPSDQCDCSSGEKPTWIFQSNL